MSKKSTYLYLAAVLILLLFGYSYFSKSNESPSVMVAGFDTKKAASDQQEKTYPQAPDFILKDLEGKDIRLSDHKGKVVLIDFWATWCPPCRKGIPELVEMQKKYGADKLIVLGINVDQGDADKVREFARDYQINYPVLFYTPDVISAYGGIEAIPTTFIVDKQGQVRQWVQGYRPKEFFTRFVDSLL
jgi:thiol-disulfide isomerase/thioredoxin